MELVEGLKMEATLKQVAESKHGLKLLALCPEYFIGVTCYSVLLGYVSAVRENTTQAPKVPMFS